ncbi:ATP-binding protein [Roseospirillum parvum]|uniref:histidine kinase n=1 Tax=Roseospirillum parvum TaxID=83401 RepID=A0A1G7TL04_9PROT|nr:ATP-binding protein [Roseospirillum parvum]SDG36008.1 two-component system, OmpR family, osmolarity sensor histidine kinase EnvZ [Roseospirillum parvum]
MTIFGTPRLLRRLSPKGLLARSLLIIVAPLILVQVITAYVFYDRHWDTITRRLTNALAGEIALVLDEAAHHPEELQRLHATAGLYLQLSFDYQEGRVLPNQPLRLTSALARNMAAALEERVRRPFLMDLERPDGKVRIDIQLPRGVLVVTTEQKRISSFTADLLIYWMVGASVLLFALATLFMRNQVRSVRRLAAAADAFGKGREIGQFKIEGAREVRQAAQAFNLMRERIGRQVAQRTEMLAGVSHDLRTPLTRMKLQLSLARRHPDSGLGADGLDDLLDDVAEMERMVEAYLAFARGEGTEAPVPTDLAGLIEEVVGRFRRHGALVDLHLERSLTLPLKVQAVDRCLSNLLANASRFARHVSVRLGERQGAAEILIDDDGPGIPEAEREEVFRPFHRVERSRNPATGGCGLGLTIARDVVRGHGGEIALLDSPLGGLRVRVRLPL